MAFMEEAVEALQKLSPIVEVGAPLIAKSFSNPLAELGLSVLTKVFEGTSNNVPDLIDKISTDPDITKKLNDAHLSYIQIVLSLFVPILSEIEKIIGNKGD